MYFDICYNKLVDYITVSIFSLFSYKDIPGFTFYLKLRLHLTGYIPLLKNSLNYILRLSIISFYFFTSQIISNSSYVNLNFWFSRLNKSVSIPLENIEISNNPYLSTRIY